MLLQDVDDSHSVNQGDIRHNNIITSKEDEYVGKNKKLTSQEILTTGLV